MLNDRCLRSTVTRFGGVMLAALQKGGATQSLSHFLINVIPVKADCYPGENIIAENAAQ
jgi:hypothetical protein